MTHFNTRLIAAFTLTACLAGAAQAQAQTLPGTSLPSDPIILVHGFGGQGTMTSGSYFHGVAGALRRAGAQVFVANLSPFAGSDIRGRDLADCIDSVLLRSGAQRVHLIAHSQGGLDSRFAISHLGYGDRVRSLTTISTPHRGSPVAAAVLLLPSFIRARVPAILNAALVAEQGAGDIDSALRSIAEGAVRFDMDADDLGDVPVFSIAGVTGGSTLDACDGGIWDAPEQVNGPSGLLVPTAAVFGGFANDGAVPVSSARFGDFLGCVAMDHFEELGATGAPASAHLEMFSNILSVVGQLEAWEQDENRLGRGRLAIR